MKQFVLGSAFLMFISSLPADSTNDHAISVAAPRIEVQKVAFLPSFGDTLPPIGYVNFCREHQADCLPERKFADRVQLTSAKLRELDQVNTAVTLGSSPLPTSSFTAKSSIGPIQPRTRAIARTTCSRSSANSWSAAGPRARS